jgi:signal transduction histidine kinase/DNA-binding response OmpR family regulator/ligand-binding sensor domain-containing protein
MKLAYFACEFCNMRLLLFGLLLPFFAWTQNSYWHSITIADGLSQGMIYDLVQDQQGFLWFATKDGLNRYDGYNFKVFTQDPYNEFSISGNTCTALLCDKKGRLWIGTEKDGLNLYDPFTQRFYRAIIGEEEQKNTGSYTIYDLREDNNGRIWIITEIPGKVFYVDPPEKFPSTANFSTWIAQATLSKRSTSKLLPANTGIKHNCLSKFHALLGEKIEISKISNGHSSDYAFVEDYQGRFWGISEDQLVAWKGKMLHQIALEKQNSYFLSLLEDGTFAITDEFHLWLFKPEELFKLSSLNSQNAFAVFPKNFPGIKKLMLDRKKNIWVGTSGYGVLRFNRLVRQFQKHLTGLSLSHLVAEKDRRIYVHCNYRPAYRFFELDRNSNTLKDIPIEINTSTWAHDALLIDHKGQHWMICHNNDEAIRRLHQYDANWRLLGTYAIPPVNEALNYNYKMLEDDQHLLWLGLTNGYLLSFNPQKKEFKIHSYQHLLLPQGAVVETYSLYQDSNRDIWIGTQQGLIRMQNAAAKPQFSIFRNSKTERKSLSNDFVSGVIDDPFLPKKQLWVSTKGGGLERLDKQIGQFEHFTEKQGLPNKVVYGVLVGKDKNLWMSTNRGLARLNPQTLVFTTYNKADGLQDDEFNTNSSAQSPQGELLFGGINGLNEFSPVQIGSQTAKPIVRIVDLKIRNQNPGIGTRKAEIPQAIEHLQKLKLAYHQNMISLEFALMDFSNPSKNRYRYRLTKIDKNWIGAGTNRFAHYTHLPSGNYTFEVLGSLDGERWSEPAILKIQVRPPFYRTWLAYVLYGLALFFLIRRWNQGQIKRVRLQEELNYSAKEKQRLAELDALRTRFFTNISHEFRTPLTLLIGPIQDLLQKYPQEKTLALMQRNVSRLHTLINQLLDLSKLEAGKMEAHPEPGDLALFLRNLLASMESMAQSKGLNFIHTQNKESYLTNFDADKIEKIVINLVSNAFKFTPEGGRVGVDVRYETQRVSISVEDTGLGIAAERLPHIFDRFYQIDDTNRRNFEGTGIGLSLVKELLMVLKGEIEVNSQEGTGTAFELSMPSVELASLPPTSKAILPQQPKLGTPDADTNVSVDSSVMDLDQLLIVEDNADLRAYIRQIFEGEYLIFEANDGEDGLKQAQELLPDLVICDLMMPRLDGFGFCKALKSTFITDHIPIVMLTARAGLDDRLEGLEIGADDYLSKPFEAKELTVRVRNLVKQRHLLRQKFSQNEIHQAQPLNNDSPRLSAKDQAFLQQLDQVIEDHLGDSHFDVEQVAKHMLLSAVQVRRKLKSLNNQTLIEYIRNYRLDKAEGLLKAGAGTVSEVAYQVGFESLPYFSKVFQERFGKNASDWK